MNSVHSINSPVGKIVFLKSARRTLHGLNLYNDGKIYNDNI